MSVVLTKEEVDKVKKYKYTTSPATYMDGVFDPWWNFCVRLLPASVSPNLITCSGMLVPFIAFGYLCTIDLTLNAILPSSMLILSGFAIFWYQTLDAIDGKHARATDNCSPLG